MQQTPPTYGSLPDQGCAHEFLGLLERFGGAGYWYVDLLQGEVFWSEQVCAAHGEPFGFRPPTVAAAIEYYHPDDRAAADEAVQTSIETGEPFSFTLRIVRKTGEIRWVEANGEARLGDDGKPAIILGTFRDITEEHQRKMELQVAANLHRSLTSAIEEMKDAFVIYDADDRMILCNEAYRTLYPQSAKMMRPGMRFEDIIRYGIENGQYLDAIGREEEWLAERLKTHENPTGPIEQRLPNGRWLRVDEFITHNNCRVGFRIDITEMKALEERLTVAAKEALSANRLKDRFLANMSHELRTPLNAIIGFSQVLQMMVEKRQANEKVGEYANDISSAGQHLLGIIEDIFSLAHMDSEEDSLHLVPISVPTILDDTRSLTGALARQHQKSVYFDEGDAGDLSMIADKTKITQVMVNLVSNAIKYCGESEKIMVSAERGADESIILKVTDEGPGIPKHMQTRIFERFERLDATQRAIEGVGIGLAISKDLVKAMNGVIGVESEVGEGSTFWIVLPQDVPTRQQIAV